MSTSCWSCGGAPGATAFCARCGKVQPPRGEDHFTVLGLPRAFAIDPEDLERRYRDLQRKLHPDRFAAKSAEERRASLARATDLNDAYRTLKDPAQRATYLLSLKGVHLRAEGGETRAADPELLMEMMELREELDGAKRARDMAGVEALARGVRARRDATLAAVETALAADASPDVVVPMLDSLRYFGRFLDEVTAIEEAAAEAGG